MHKIECYIHAYRLAPLINLLNQHESLVQGLWSCEVKGMGGTPYHDRMSGSRFKTDAILMAQVTVLAADENFHSLAEVMARHWEPGLQDDECMLVSRVMDFSRRVGQEA